MKPTALVLSLVVAITAFIIVMPSAEAKKVEVYSRNFLRPDKSKTVSIRDDNKMRQELRTYSKGGVLIWKGIYRLDKYGRPRSAEMFDAQNKLLFRARYGFHVRTGQLRQELFFNSKNQMVRAIDYPLDRFGRRVRDRSGKPAKPKAYNIKVVNGKYKRMKARDFHSTHPDQVGVKQAAAAARAGKPAPGKRTSRYGASGSSTKRTSPSALSRRGSTNSKSKSRVNTSRGSGSSLLIPRGGSSRYRR